MWETKETLEGGLNVAFIGDVELNLGSSNPERQASRFRVSVC